MTDRLRHLWLTAAAILALASCTQDDMGEGGSPYAGDSPVVFSATGITPIGATRATVDGTWEGTEEVMVEVGFNANSRIYVVKPSADKKSATLEAAPGVEPFKWSEVEGNQVKAYTFNSVSNDQSTPEKYRASDIIAGSVDEMTRESVLNFNHQVARVVIKVSNGDIESDKVELVVGSRTITPYRDEVNKRYLALVNRTNGASVSVKIKHGGKDYIYTHATNADLEGGNSYAINVTIFNPMHITDEATLKAWAKAVKDDPTVSAIVDNDFSMSTPPTGGSNWEPVAEFEGIFDGNGHTISGIVVNKTEYTGFIAINYGTVKNLTLKNANITGNHEVGAVAGINRKTIENCHVTGNSVITVNESTYYAYAGGVAGNNERGTILACHVAKECFVKGIGSVGGIAGCNKLYAQITGCYALCSLEGTKDNGGISGCAYDGRFTACYSRCTYSSGSNIGGIVGNIWKYNPTFSVCYWETNTFNCEYGVGNVATNPDGVTYSIWPGAHEVMNEKLKGTGYQYENGTTDEPFVLRKTQQ